MTRANKANQKIILILNKIVEEYDLGNKTNTLMLGTGHFLMDTAVDINQFISILNNIKERAIISSFIVHRNAIDEYDNSGKQDLVCIIKIPTSFKARAEDYREYLSSVEPKDKQSSGLILYLDQVGNLWHGDKDKFCYQMAVTKGRLSIIKYLVENKGYQPTKNIASTFGKSDQNIRTEINKIRAKIKHHLDLEEVIESDSGLGYRINPKYKINVIK